MPKNGEEKKKCVDISLSIAWTILGWKMKATNEATFATRSEKIRSLECRGMRSRTKKRFVPSHIHTYTCLHARTLSHQIQHQQIPFRKYANNFGCVDNTCVYTIKMKASSGEQQSEYYCRIESFDGKNCTRLGNRRNSLINTPSSKPTRKNEK